jgi:hypothetical protein
MKTLELDDDGRTAQLGPGLISGEVARRLDAVGKRTGKTLSRDNFMSLS